MAESYRTGPSLRTLVDSAFSEHIKADNPQIVEFMKAFADYLEDENKSGYYINRIDQQRDVSRVSEEFLTNLQQEVGVTVPRSPAADPRVLYTQLVDFYLSRGTPDSIQAFFKLLYGDNVELYFPKDDMLIPSDGKWFGNAETIINNPDITTPKLVYTTSAETALIEGDDDNGNPFIIDNAIVFVDGVHQEEFTIKSFINTTTERLEYTLTLPAAVPAGTEVKIYNSGMFSTNDGFVSDFKYIQDSYFYQKFSYVLRTGQNTEVWRNAFNRLIHPAGFIFFGEILLLILATSEYIDDVAAPMVQPGSQRSIGRIPIILPFTDAGASFVKAGPQTSYVASSDDTYYSGDQASFLTVGFADMQNDNEVGASEWFEYLKFNYSSPIANFAHYTTLDAINKNIIENIESEIEFYDTQQSWM